MYHTIPNHVPVRLGKFSLGIAAAMGWGSEWGWDDNHKMFRHDHSSQM